MTYNITSHVSAKWIFLLMVFYFAVSCKPLSAQPSMPIDESNNPHSHNRMHNSQQTDKQQVKDILSVLDDHTAPMANKMALWSDDLVYLAPGQEPLTSKKTLEAHLEEQNSHGHSEKTHKILELHSYEEIVLVRGQIDGTYYPKGAGRPAQFRNKTLFIFKRQPDQSLIIWRAMYNHEPFISSKQ